MCLVCDYRFLELCAVCRVEWAKVTQSSSYVCLACRAKPLFALTNRPLLVGIAFSGSCSFVSV